MAMMPPICSIAGAIATGSINSAACQFTCGEWKCGTANHGAAAIGAVSTIPMARAIK